MSQEPTIGELALAGWLEELVDLKRSNPLLDLDPGADGVRLTRPEPELLYADLLRGDAVTLVRAGGADRRGTADGEAVKPVPGVLRALRTEQETALAGEGTHVLFVAFGLLAWESGRAGALRSPLLLLPVTLGRPSRGDDYILSAVPAGALRLNPALELLLAQEDLTFPMAPPALGDGLADWLDGIRRRVSTRPGWSVLPYAALGVFRFDKYPIYEDLGRNGAEFLRHPVVLALAGDSAARAALPHSAGRPAEVLDAAEDPAAVFQVLDADGSQRQMIDAANRGAHVVVQGPPGAGKSQTITNLIADALGGGKSVLFVSEKKPALDVVAARLAAAGFAPFFLLLHDDAAFTAGEQTRVRHELAEALGRGTSAAPNPATDPALAADLAELAALRIELNDYLRRLTDDDTPLGRSAYEVIGELCALEWAPRLRFDFASDLIGGLTEAKLREMEETVARLTQIADIVRNPEANPWSGAGIAPLEWTPEERARLEERLAAAADAAADLAAELRTVWDVWGLQPDWKPAPGGAAQPAPDSMEGVRHLRQLLADVARRGDALALAPWFRRKEFGQACDAAGAYAGGTGEADVLRRRLSERFGPGLLGASTVQTLIAAIDDAPVLTGEHGYRMPRRPVVQPPVRVSAGLLLGELGELREIAGGFAAGFGVPLPQTVGEAAWLATLVELVAAGRRLPRAGFARGESARALATLARTGAEQAAARARRRELEADYTTLLFELAGRADFVDDLFDDSGLDAFWRSLFSRDVRTVERAARADTDLDRAQARGWWRPRGRC